MSSIPESPNSGSPFRVCTPLLYSCDIATHKSAYHRRVSDNNPSLRYTGPCITISKTTPLMTIRHTPPLHLSMVLRPLPRLQDAPYVQARLRRSLPRSSRTSSHRLHTRLPPPTRRPRTASLPPMPSSGNKNLGRPSNMHSLLLPSRCRRR